MKLEKQETTVLNHLQQYKSITSWGAIKMYRITRLSEYIRRLKQRGYDIKTLMIQNPKTKTRYGKYVLKG